MALLPDHPATLDIVWRLTLCALGVRIIQHAEQPSDHYVGSADPDVSSPDFDIEFA